MPHWSENFTGHEIHSLLSNLKTQLDALQQVKDLKPDDLSQIARLAEVLAFISDRLERTRPALIPLGQLNQLLAHCKSMTHEASSFSANKSPGHLQNANNQADAAIAQISMIPNIPGRGDMRGLNQAMDSLKQTVSSHHTQLNDEMKTTAKALGDVRKSFDTLNQEISAQKGRLDTAISQFQTQFSTAEAKRLEQHAATVKSGEESFKQALKAIDLEKAESLAAFRQEAASLIEDEKAQWKRFRDQTESTVSSTIDEIERHKATAEQLIHIITNTGMVGGYQKNANLLRWAKWLWRGAAVTAFVGLIGFAVYAMLHTLDQQFGLPQFGARVFVALTFGLLGAYAALQGDKADTQERKHRRMELELASVGPFLRDLPVEQQHTIKSQLSSRFFANGDDPDKKPEDNPTTGTLLDVTKMLIETVGKFAQK